MFAEINKNSVVKAYIFTGAVNAFVAVAADTTGFWEMWSYRLKIGQCKDRMTE